MICAAQKLTDDDYEIILINDGSPDNSLQLALELQSQNKSIKVVDLSRNFGHHAAIVAGLTRIALRRNSKHGKPFVAAEFRT